MIKRNLSFFALCIFFLFIVTGCASKRIPLHDDSDAAMLWQRFEQLSARTPSYHALSGSLRFGPVNNTRRVTFLLWSSPSSMKEEDRAVRLEVNAGVGANVANALFANRRMLLLLPREQKAYTGEDSPFTLRRLIGLPLPLRMANLNELLAGRYFQALGLTSPESCITKENGNIVYSWKKNGQSMELELNREALPVCWSAKGLWNIRMDFDEKSLPRRIDGTMDSDGEEMRMVLLVKERHPENNAGNYRMNLSVPENFTVYSLNP